jgi:hypothetical protein
VKDLPPVFEFALEVGAVAAAITGVLVLVERLWKPISKFLQREINGPVEEKIIDLTDKLDQHTEYVRYHLGPNGNAPAVHVRVQKIEGIVDAEV